MNHLQHETSPYLLQHAHNPVNWYAWKPEAFERARAEQKPILVSIGYSTCHWCHVMERESFENPAVAAIMNKYFVNIKVDREERPDVDAIYMEACQMLTGGGGWPLNCFLTPDGKPFYAGTYFPPRPAHNRPSWTELLTHLADIWENKRDSALDQAERLLGHISRDTPPVGQLEGNNSDKANLETIFTQIKRQFDHAEGGFGGAPKFPSTMAIRFLLEYYWHYRQPEALQHAFFSLEKMISGGIYDQVGGGFARYATDRAWLAPHFEKMLYDNALLVGVLADACKIARETPGYERYAALFEDTITETLDYVAREMTSPEGAFYSAQDADSEGVEGKFYVWDKTEIDALLGADAPDFCQYYDVSPAGNWEGHNILHRPNPGENAAETHRKFGPLRKKLLDARAKRIWPLLDTKVLFDWNALMATAYAKAFTALGTESYRQIAVRNLDFLLNNLRKPAPDAATPPPLRHSRTQDVAFLDDYAFFLNALVDVYEITFERKYLQLAETYTDYVISAFFDPEQNLFFFTDSAQSDIILRKKDLYDNATPSGNSTMAHNLQRLGIMLDRTDYGQIADKMLDQLRPSAIQFPLSFGRWVSALVQQAEPPAEFAVVGANALEKAVALQKKFVPHAVIAASQTQTDEIPLLAGKVANGQTLIYLCRDFACQKPVVSLEELWEMMETFK